MMEEYPGGENMGHRALWEPMPKKNNNNKFLSIDKNNSNNNSNNSSNKNNNNNNNNNNNKFVPIDENNDIVRKGIKVNERSITKSIWISEQICAKIGNVCSILC
jgi:hypothetical protein